MGATGHLPVCGASRLGDMTLDEVTMGEVTMRSGLFPGWIFLLLFLVSHGSAVACGGEFSEDSLDSLRLDRLAGDTAGPSAQDSLNAGLKHFAAQRLVLAEDAFRAAQQRAHRDRQWQIEASALINLGNLMTRRNNLLAAERHYHAGINIARQKGFWKLASNGYYNLAILYKERGELNRARRIYQRALATINGREAPKLHTAILNNLGNIYREQGKFRRAERVLKFSLELSEAFGDDSAAKLAAANLARLYRDDFGRQGVGVAYKRSISSTPRTAQNNSHVRKGRFTRAF